jgi:hypothetical protein
LPALSPAYKSQLRHIERASAILDELKLTSGCVDCGFNTWPEALHFDHIDPMTKHRSLGWVSDRSRLTSKGRLARYLDHISRYCVIRCANCHAHRTKQEQQWLVRRGDTAPLADDPRLF